MDNPHKESLDQRVERLEKTVEELKRSIDNLTGQIASKTKAEAKPGPVIPTEQPTPRSQPAQAPPPPPPPPGAPRTPQQPAAAPRPQPTQPTYFPPPRPSKPVFTIPEHMQKFEYWLNKVGIGLMLFAVVFLFKYSIDQGWLTPSVRVMFGLALGVAFIVLGLRLSKKRHHFALVLLGGGIATFYITGFAAFQILELVSHPASFGFMVGVTVLSFVLSLHQDDAILSIIGTLGGLGTPFLLYTGQGNLPGLITYTCLVLTGTLAIYFFKGWRVTLWLSVVGGWVILVIGLFEGLPLFFAKSSDYWSLQWGIAYACLTFWLVPVAREVVTAVNPGRWPKTLLGIADSRIALPATNAMDRHVHVLSVSTPLIALTISLSIWPHVDKTLWGWIVLGAAVVYAAVCYGLGKWQTLRNLAYTQGAMGVVLFTIALCLFFEKETLQIALTAEALLLHLIARRRSDKIMAAGGHGLFVVLGIWLLLRLLFEYDTGTPKFDLNILIDLVGIGAAIVVSLLTKSINVRRVYFLFAYVAFAGWLILQFESMENLLIVLLTLEAAVLYLTARLWREEALVNAAHVSFMVIGGYLITRLVEPRAGDTILLNRQALADLGAMTGAAGIAFWTKDKSARFVYLLAVHVAFLLWLLRELSSLTDGQGYVTIAWGIYAVILLIAGLRRNIHKVRLAALVTLFLVVGKLFLVDLAKLETIWRVLLFFGFGGVFLALSYYFQSLWKAAPGEKGGAEETPSA